MSHGKVWRRPFTLHARETTIYFSVVISVPHVHDSLSRVLSSMMHLRLYYDKDYLLDVKGEFVSLINSMRVSWVLTNFLFGLASFRGFLSRKTSFWQDCRDIFLSRELLCNYNSEIIHTAKYPWKLIGFVWKKGWLRSGYMRLNVADLAAFLWSNWWRKKWPQV